MEDMGFAVKAMFRCGIVAIGGRPNKRLAVAGNR